MSRSHPESPGVAHPPVAGAASRWRGAGRVALLAGTDLLSLLLAGTAAFLLWAHPVRGQSIALYLPAAPAAVFAIFAYAQARLYPGFGLGPVEVLRRYWTVTLLFFLTLAVFFLAVAYAVPGATITLHPEVERVRTSREIVADPQLE